MSFPDTTDQFKGQTMNWKENICNLYDSQRVMLLHVDKKDK